MSALRTGVVLTRRWEKFYSNDDDICNVRYHCNPGTLETKWKPNTIRKDVVCTERLEQLQMNVTGYATPTQQMRIRNRNENKKLQPQPLQTFVTL